MSATAPPSSISTSSENMSRDELILANRRLQQDNEWIKGELYKLRLEQRMGSSGGGKKSKPHGTSDDAADERAVEVLTYVNQLRVDGATIIRQHEELLDLRQRCTFYATALEETTAHLDSMKQLYRELQAAAVREEQQRKGE